ncbi:hypothetical protein OQA88_7417 [Cercophora sp. LCS_1]
MALDPLRAIGPVATDPRRPFTPANYDGLNPFKPEAMNRAVKLRGEQLAPVGLLYPNATFCVARFPPSENTTVRLSGIGLAKFAALLGNGKAKEEYIVNLRIRDWPSGAVARFIWNSENKHLAEELQNNFELIQGEIWRFKRYRVMDNAGNFCGHAVKVMRGFEGCNGKIAMDILNKWMDEHDGVLGEDKVGAKTIELIAYDMEAQAKVGAGGSGKPRERYKDEVDDGEDGDDDDNDDSNDHLGIGGSGSTGNIGRGTRSTSNVGTGSSSSTGNVSTGIGGKGKGKMILRTGGSKVGISISGTSNIGTGNIGLSVSGTGSSSTGNVGPGNISLGIGSPGDTGTGNVGKGKRKAVDLGDDDDLIDDGGEDGSIKVESDDPDYAPGGSSRRKSARVAARVTKRGRRSRGSRGGRT